MPTDKRLNITLNADDIKNLHHLIKKLEEDSDKRFNYVDTIRLLIKFGNTFHDQLRCQS